MKHDFVFAILVVLAFVIPVSLGQWFWASGGVILVSLLWVIAGGYPVSQDQIDNAFKELRG